MIAATIDLGRLWKLRLLVARFPLQIRDPVTPQLGGGKPLDYPEAKPDA